MRKLIRNIALLLAMAFALHGCFKSTVSYTCFNLAIYDQISSDAIFKPSTDIDSYAFYADTTEWYIASWEDALARRITNKITGEVLAEPATIGEFNSSQQYQTSMVVNQTPSMLVVVNPTLRIYAYRNYEVPENLSEVYAKLYIAAWRPSHTSSGWTIINSFYESNKPEDEGEAEEPVTE